MDHAKKPSATKRGPGRYHAHGHQKATPTPSKGASASFVLHAATDAKKERRALVKAHGRRGALKALKHWRREHKAANDERTDALSTRHYEAIEA